MKVMYVAARYHTNQIPVVEGWIRNGHQVCFVSQFRGESEDYNVLQPVVMGYSVLFQSVLHIYNLISKRKVGQTAIPAYFKAQFGVPALSKVKRLLHEFQPDVVILRDRCLYSVVFTHCCKRKNIKTILYNQTPYYEDKEEKTDILHRLIRRYCPTLRMTPVLGHAATNTTVRDNTYYVPFVIEPHITPEQKHYFHNNKIHILCVGKFEQRKHHMELIQAISRLSQKDDIQVTLIGESSREKHRQYLAQLKQLVSECSMEEQVTIKTNLTLTQVYEEYQNADVFILPSTGEFASISQLEAMSCSLAVLCSDTNGTADCIQEGQNGYLFKDNDFDDLKHKIQLLICDRDNIVTMGCYSYSYIQKQYSFQTYYDMVLKMIATATDQEE